jgi:hypothetical protein
MVPEIDLFVTATDLQGLPPPLSLSDKVVDEYRHRSVFNFKKNSDGKTGATIFGSPQPFLAFAARCTSSFPFAFEPMRLADIDGGRLDRMGKILQKSIRDETRSTMTPSVNIRR